MYDKIKEDIKQTYYLQNFPNDGQRFIVLGISEMFI
jgi:hypothetical protein